MVQMGFENHVKLNKVDILIWVVVSNIIYFHPYLGKWSNLANIFQMGWNHQLVIYSACLGQVQPPEVQHKTPLKAMMGLEDDCFPFGASANDC